MDSSLSRNSSRVYLFLGLILIFGFYLRLQGNAWGLPTKDRFTPLYGDEYNVLNFVHLMHPSLHHIDAPVWFYDPTFFYYQLGAILEVASLARIIHVQGDKDFYLMHPEQYAGLYVAGRFLVALYGTAIIYILFLIGRTLTGTDMGGLLSALFYAVIPLAVISCHIIDVGIPVTFWLALAYFCLLYGLQSSNECWSWIAIVAAGLSFSTKYTAAPIFCLFPYVALKKRWSLKKISLAAIVSATAFICGTPFALPEWRRFLHDFLEMFSFFGNVTKAPMVPWHMVYPFAHFAYSVGTALTIVCFLGLIIQVAKWSPGGILAVLFLFPYFVLSGANVKHMARYMNETLPFLIPFAAVVLVPLLESGRLGKQCAALVILLMCLSRVPYTLAFNRSLATEQAPQDQASAWMTTHLPPYSVIGLEKIPDFMWPGHVYMQYWKGIRYPERFVHDPPYRFSLWDRDQNRWIGRVPDYFIGTRYAFDPASDKAVESRELNTRARVESQRGFQAMVAFERHLKWGPFSYSFPTLGGLDWLIFLPEITFYSSNSRITSTAVPKT